MSLSIIAFKSIMRVGILTLPPLSNYGGILQAYALQTILQRMGHEACIIVYKRRYHASFPMWKVPFVYGKRIYMKIVGKYCLPIFYEREYNRVMNCPGEDTKLFVKKYLKCRFIADFSNIKQTDYDAIIVGSDQVWRPKYFVEPIEMAYLGFAEKWSRQIKRISYAASFGTDAWEYNRNDSIKCKKLAAAFDAVSVRENSGKHLCHEHFGIDAEVMPDPTLLLSRADYIGLFREALIPKSSGTLLTYILDETEVKMQIIKRVAEEKNIVPFSVNSNYHHATRLSSENTPPHMYVVILQPSLLNDGCAVFTMRIL